MGDAHAARGIELMYNGDTAIVATQYSFLPSWISFLADKRRPSPRVSCWWTPSRSAGRSSLRDTAPSC